MKGGEKGCLSLSDFVVSKYKDNAFYLFYFKFSTIIDKYKLMAGLGVCK